MLLLFVFGVCVSCCLMLFILDSVYCLRRLFVCIVYLFDFSWFACWVLMVLVGYCYVAWFGFGWLLLLVCGALFALLFFLFLKCCVYCFVCYVLCCSCLLLCCFVFSFVCFACFVCCGRCLWYVICYFTVYLLWLFYLVLFDTFCFFALLI